MPKLKFLKGEKGLVDSYIALIISVTIAMVVLVFSVELLTVPKAQNVLQTAAEMLAKSESVNGCVTNNTQSAVSSYLLKNQLDPAKVYFAAPPSSTQNYGTSAGSTSQPNLTLGYDLDVFELSSAHVWHQYIQAQVPVNMSAYISNAVSDTSGCVNTSIFGGTQVTPGQIGTGSPSNGPSSSITPGVSASSVSATIPTPAIQGAFANITGTTNLPLSQVSIFGAGYSASTTTDASGNFSFPAIFTVAGTNQPITVVAGTASQIYTINVIPATVHSVIFTGPSPASVKIGQPFAITGIAYDSTGMVVPDGTSLNITSSDTTDIPNQTVTMSSGQFRLNLPNGITQPITSFTVTNTDTAPNTNYSVTVTPSDPQKITLSSNVTTLTAGNSVILNGSVYGYNNTPVQDGTQVQLADNGNILGTTSTTGGNYTLTVPLTVAGNNTIIAQVTGFSSVQTALNITVDPSVPYSAVGIVASPNPVNVGSNTGISGMVKDQYGNLINGQSYTLQTNLSAPNPTSVLTTGPFGFNASFTNPGYQTVSLSYGGRTIGSITVNIVSNIAANGFTLKSSQSTYTITAGQSVPNITFTLTDSNGNPVSGQVIAFSGVAGTPSSATTNASGQVMFSSSVLTSAQAYTLSATATNVPNLVAMVGITVTPGASNKVAVTISPTTTPVWTVGNQVPLPTVFGCVTDIYGNTIPTANVTISGGYGANALGVVGANGFFSIALTPTNVGGPFPLNFIITSIYGNCSTIQGTLTVTAVPVIDTSKVLSGYVIDGQTGTMINQGAYTNSVSTGISGTTIYTRIPQGAYLTNGGSGYPEITTNVPDLVSGNILAGKNILGVAGGITNQGGYANASSNWANGSGTLYSWIPYGAYLTDSGSGSGTPGIINYDPNYIASNIANGVKIFGLTGTFVGAPPTHGSQTWTTPGTYYWTVPSGVSGVLGIATGGGGAGGYSSYGYSTYWLGCGGGGGGGTNINMITVTPGQVLTINVGAGGAALASLGVGGAGGVSSIDSLSAGGGNGSARSDMWGDQVAASGGTGGGYGGAGATGAIAGYGPAYGGAGMGGYGNGGIGYTYNGGSTNGRPGRVVISW